MSNTTDRFKFEEQTEDEFYDVNIANANLNKIEQYGALKTDVQDAFEYQPVGSGNANDFLTPNYYFVFNVTNTPGYGFLDVCYYKATGFLPSPNGVILQKWTNFKTGVIKTRCYYANTWTSWNELAMSDSNVASATKLKASKKIGNASFDGTDDITLEDIGALAKNSLVQNTDVNDTSRPASSAVTHKLQENIDALNTIKTEETSVDSFKCNQVGKIVEVNFNLTSDGIVTGHKYANWGIPGNISKPSCSKHYTISVFNSDGTLFLGYASVNIETTGQVWMISQTSSSDKCMYVGTLIYITD